MDKKIKKAILFLGIIAVFFLKADFVLAFELRYPDILGFSINNDPSFPEYAKYFFNLGIALACFLAVIAIAFGGVCYLIDFARGKIASEGKEWIKSGSLGLMIVLCAYLIAYTINPQLVIFDLKGLAPLNFVTNSFNPPGPSVPVEIYSEIPIGTLTENLLTRTTDCYDFDDNGDPIPGDQGPTYLNHDRTDCVLKLSQAAEKKALIVKKLSDEIINLMNRCNCGAPPSPLKPFSFYTTYAHMDKIYLSDIDVSTKKEVKRGDTIGEVGQIGTTGTGAYPHIHFAVGLPDPNGVDSISFDIYSSVIAPGGSMGARASGVPGPMPIPSIFTQDYLNYILNSLIAPVSLGHCTWTEAVGSLLHSGYAYWAQDWICPSQNVTSSAQVMVMAGSKDIKSTVVAKDLNVGNVVIKHDYTPPATPVNPNPAICRTNCQQCPNATRCPVYKDGKLVTTSTDPSLCPDNCNLGCSGPGDCCPKNSGVKDSAGKELTVKEVTERGPIKINDCNGLEKKYAGLDEFRSQYNNDYNQIKNKIEIQPPPKIGGKLITIINKDLWQKLRLVDQLTYLKGKINEIKSKVEQDLSQLKSAESSLGQCYIADTYIDFLKTYEQTNKKDKIILIERTFSDPVANQLVNPAKYCKGFQYNNSTCYNQCQKACPESANDIKCFSGCPVCDSNNRNYENCLKNQNDCIKICRNKQGCTKSNSFDTFQGCMGFCKQGCLDSCNTACSVDDKNKCQEKCNNDSKCLLDNENKCLINVVNLKDCVKNFGNNNENLKNCADNSALCKYCSDQYAGYPECLKSPWNLQDKYSSSFIYQNPDYQKCAEPYKSIIVNNSSADCLTLYPETAKCPSASKCPQCPCDDTSESTTNGSTITENRVCSSVCEDFSYNDDPLTFYCQQSWWLKKDEVKNTKPLGGEKICPKEREIPVGKTIDDAEKWGQDFKDKIDKITQKIQDMIEYMKKIGEEKNYCRCDSKCEKGELICQAKCVFNQTETIVTNPATGQTTKTVICSCVRGNCSGNPCQKMINLLQGKTENQECSKGIIYKGIEFYYIQIKNAVKDFMISVIGETSDIVKELNYSRQKTNECSVVQNNYDQQEVRALSCTRVLDEILSPIIDKDNKTIIGSKAINSYCYGKELGKILKTPEPMADNWFCCENRKK